MPRWLRVAVLLFALPAAMPVVTAAQARVGAQEVAPYFRTLGEHFRVSRSEMAVLVAWDLPPEHLAVVLFVAHRSGASPDAVVAQRRGGRSWNDVARRFGLDASSFHVLVGRDASLGRLAPVYDRFGSTARAEWPSLELADAEIVDLVNMRVLASTLGVLPTRVLEVAARSGSFVAAHHELAG